MYDVTCIPLTDYSTRLPFDVGAHRELAEIDEKDILAIALDFDVDLGDFDRGVREVLTGFEQSANCFDVIAETDRILDNSAPRLATLRRFLGM